MSECSVSSPPNETGRKICRMYLVVSLTAARIFTAHRSHRNEFFVASCATPGLLTHPINVSKKQSHETTHPHPGATSVVFPAARTMLFDGVFNLYHEVARHDDVARHALRLAQGFAVVQHSAVENYLHRVRSWGGGHRERGRGLGPSRKSALLHGEDLVRQGDVDGTWRGLKT